MNLVLDPGVVLSLITLVAGGTIYTFLKSRHIERMMHLQLGIPLDNPHKSFVELKFGLLFVGIGVGILSAFSLNKIYSRDIFEFYPAFIFLFGGLGLLISFFMVQSHKREE